MNNVAMAIVAVFCGLAVSALGGGEAVVVIPARAASTRFPLKVLAPLAGKPMVQHVWERAMSAQGIQSVLIATDDTRIEQAALGFGAQVRMTPSELPSGTDRVALVASKLNASVIVNVQGDEPLLPSSAIESLVAALRDSPDFDMATLAFYQAPGNPESAALCASPHVVKVVTDLSSKALYFSRQPLVCDTSGGFWKHVGIYAYRRDALLKLSELPPTQLERTERLEQLRALEHGYRIKVVPIQRDTIAVDIAEDLTKVEAALGCPHTVLK